ncbi:MAG: hypothetical protein ABI562_06695 [Chloroflexota bacterium]
MSLPRIAEWASRRVAAAIRRGTAADERAFFDGEVETSINGRAGVVDSSVAAVAPSTRSFARRTTTARSSSSGSGRYRSIIGIAVTQAACLDWTLIQGRRHLDRTLRIYAEHYNRGRPHRALGLTPPLAAAAEPMQVSPRDVRRRDLLGGLIHEYHGLAA